MPGPLGRLMARLLGEFPVGFREEFLAGLLAGILAVLQVERESMGVLLALVVEGRAASAEWPAGLLRWRMFYGSRFWTGGLKLYSQVSQPQRCTRVLVSRTFAGHQFTETPM